MTASLKKLRALALAATTASLLGACGGGGSSDAPKSTMYKKVVFNPIGGYLHSDAFDKSAAEITAFDPKTKRGFVVNAKEARVDVLDLSDPASPKLIDDIDVSLLGGGVNSVAVHDDMVALAVEAKTKTDNGTVAILNAETLELINSAKVGALPDMVTFSPNGKYILCANEGEPSGDYKTDPEGSISIINVSDLNNIKTATADFEAFNNRNDELNNLGIRIFGPNASVAQDLEPEYITVSDDSKTAYVTLQENNAVAAVDIGSATVTAIHSLGYKDHSADGNGLDASNKDNKINIKIQPVFGMYQPDAIASYSVGGKTYLITANEGDAREYEYEKDGKTLLSYTDETSVSDLIDSGKRLASKFNNFCGKTPCSDKTQLGKLKVTNTLGDANNDGVYDALYSFGARSFSIWDADSMTQVYDSGRAFADIIAAKYPKYFNASNDNNELDDRSDNKGSEPEGVVVGKVGNQIIAFIGLERISSVVAYDVTDPKAPAFMGEINTRKWKLSEDEFKNMADGNSGLKPNVDGDLGPEGLTFISAKDSPNGKPLLFVGYEVSGTSRIFELNFMEK